MPDITDTILGFSINGYFKQWYGHALIGIFTLDLLGGLFITWLIVVVANRFLNFRVLHPRLQALLSKAPLNGAEGAGDSRNRSQLRVWTLSMLVGILSHVGFDLISHSTNLLLYPWYENARWFPDWWYRTWFEILPLAMFGHSYSVGIFSVSWGLLTLIGIILFIRFFSPKNRI